MAEALALVNLVAAKAQSGSDNALFEALAEWGIMKAAAGFKDGGYTGDDGVSEVAGVVHGQEYVVTAEDTKKFGLIGADGSDFGRIMEQQFKPTLEITHYKQQAEQLSAAKLQRPQSAEVLALKSELVAIKQAIQKQPKTAYQLEQATEHSITIARKVTEGRMTSQERIKKVL